MEAIKLVFKNRRDNSSTKAGKMERKTTDSPVGLEDLPVEVLDVVVKNLTMIDLSQLRLVSKAMLFLTSGTRKWRALEHFKSTYERCLEQTGLEPPVYSTLEFLCFEFNGAEEGSTCVLCGYRMQVLEYLCHHIHIPTQRGRSYNHMAREVNFTRRSSYFRNLFGPWAAPGVNTCERNWRVGIRVTLPHSWLPLVQMNLIPEPEDYIPLDEDWEDEIGTLGTPPAS